MHDLLPETLYILTPAPNVPAVGHEETETAPLFATNPAGEVGLLVWSSPQAAEAFCQANANGYVVGVVPSADIQRAQSTGMYQQLIMDLPPGGIERTEGGTLH